MYKLILLRHGESVWNSENRFTGWMDVDLSPKGEKVLNSKASPDSALVSVVIKTFGLVQSKEYVRYTTLTISIGINRNNPMNKKNICTA